MNLAANIEKSIPKHVQCIFNDICKHVHDRGSRAYLVGGVVRDLLLGYRNYDFDIVIEDNAISLAKLIAKATEAVLTVHEQFKTARLDYADYYIDLATSRNEKYKHPGALPDIRQADLLTDLSRRDFTINAMAVSINTEDYGELIDPYHGLYDLNHQLIRILHNNSFVDDATRILRGLRYQQRFGFKFEKTTERLLRKNIDMLFTITGDRLRYELEQILKEDTHGSIIQQLYEYGILKEISLPVKEKTAINNYIEWTKSIDKESQWYEAYICLLTYSLDKEEIEKFIERLNFPSNIAAILVDTCDLKSKLSYSVGSINASISTGAFISYSK